MVILFFIVAIIVLPNVVEFKVGEDSEVEKYEYAFKIFNSDGRAKEVLYMIGGPTYHDNSCVVFIEKRTKNQIRFCGSYAVVRRLKT